MGWFDGAGLGMFVHWDHASQQGLELSWPLVGGVFSLPRCQAVPVDRYHSSAATFDPTAFDAPALARLARRTGMTYGVFGARHHSGYSMWPTRASPFSVANSPCRRDLVGEFAAAFRAEGLRVGLYYSLSDWSHPDYPAFTEADKPYVFGRSPRRATDEQWARFWDYLVAQLTELLTDYGPIDALWFDGAWERPARAWRAEALLAHVRSLQPDVLVNDRLPGCGDFATPEQFVPPEAPARRWEACLTMNESWGYNPSDPDYKSARALVHALAEVAGRGGNLLLNVSPRGDGSLPPEQLERLGVVGGWMAAHGEAVRGTAAGLAPWQFYGPSTRRGDRIYLFLLARPYDTVTVRGLPVRRVGSVRVLASGRELDFSTRCAVLDQLAPDPSGEVTVAVPEDALDPFASVLALDVEPPPR